MVRNTTNTWGAASASDVVAEAVEMADRLFFLSDRPTHIILEKALPPPRGGRSSDVVASISDEMRALIAQAAIEHGKS